MAILGKHLVQAEGAIAEPLRQDAQLLVQVCAGGIGTWLPNEVPLHKLPVAPCMHAALHTRHGRL